MRPLLWTLLLISPLLSRAEDPTLSVVLDFEHKLPVPALQEMQRELQAVISESGTRLNYRLRDEVGAESFDDVIVIKFNGQCKVDHFPIVFDERGPLAFTHTVNGEVLPFSTVYCERVRKSVRSAMWGGEFKEADVLLGRALGRVVAHELYHILGKTHGHGKDGIGQKSLSGRKLISGTLRLDPADLQKLRTED
jgi:hypothetical protein